MHLVNARCHYDHCFLLIMMTVSALGFLSMLILLGGLRKGCTEDEVFEVVL